MLSTEPAQAMKLGDSINSAEPQGGHRSGRLPGGPIKWTTVQVHHSRNEKLVSANTVYYRERESIEVELSILSSNVSPALRFEQNPS
jgi:hypothetical protein